VTCRLLSGWWITRPHFKNLSDGVVLAQWGVRAWPVFQGFGVGEHGENLSQVECRCPQGAGGGCNPGPSPLFRLCKPGEDKILTGTPVSAYRYCLMPGLLASKWLRTKVSVGHGPAGTTRDEKESLRLPAPGYSCCRKPCAQHYVKSETTIQGCMGHTEMRNTAHWWVVSSGSTYGMPILPKPNQRVFQAVQ
jgi:hypothetical protein